MQFIDLKTQLEKIKAGIDDRIQTVLAHGKYIMGPDEAAIYQFFAFDYIYFIVITPQNIFFTKKYLDINEAFLKTINTIEKLRKKYICNLVNGIYYQK